MTDPAAAVPEAQDGRCVTQTILATPELQAAGIYGNCVQAAVASLTEKPLDAVPHFAARRDRMRCAFPCLMFGDSPRGTKHAVAFIDGQVWDPHPSRDGLTKVDECWRIFLADDYGPEGFPAPSAAVREGERERLAAAWDYGWRAGWDDRESGDGQVTPNAYWPNDAAPSLAAPEGTEQ